MITLLYVFPFLEKWDYPLHGNIIFNLGMGSHILAEYPETYQPYFSNSTWSNLKLIGFIAGVNILLWLWFRFSQTLFFLVKKNKRKWIGQQHFHSPPQGFTIKLENVIPCERIWFRVWRFPTKSTAAIVGAEADPTIFYQLRKNEILQTQKNGWSQITTEFVIPKNFRDSSLTFYILTRQKITLGLIT